MEMILRKIKRILRKIKRILRKVKKVIINNYYLQKYYKSKIDDNVILIESKNGNDIAGNMFYILKELQNEKYSNFIIYLVVEKSNLKKISSILNKYNISKVRFVRSKSLLYYKLLATAKYLFNDTSFSKFFIKKKNQIYTNTWHGTPLKHMSNDVPSRRYAMGNVKRNFLMCDYLVYPNKEMEEKMLSAYSFEQLYQGNILNIGYPRNSIFFNRNREKEIRDELNLNNKKIIVYMPTWRGDMNNKENEKQNEDIKKFLDQLDKKLNDDEIFYVKLHVFNKIGLNLSKYKHVKDFPNDYETYDFLNIADILVTDYSSVFFDFANSRKKIILFTYDKENYIETRGLYYDINDFPFDNVSNINDLITSIRKEEVKDYSEFLDKFATFDKPNSAKELLDIVINNKKTKFIHKTKKNGKENVIIFSGTLALNGLTTSLKSFLNIIDLDKENIFITFREKGLRRFPNRLSDLPKKVEVYPICDGFRYTFSEIISYILFFKFNLSYKFVIKKLDKLYEREILRFYGYCNFSKAIHYTGYDVAITNLFQRFECNNAIFVHNDMIKEINSRHNQHFKTLKEAYNKYNKVCVVTQDIFDPTYKISGKKENIVIFNNAFDANNVLSKSKNKIKFDNETESNVNYDDLVKLLKNKNVKKFINIGRFSPEKGQIKLINAFEKYYSKHPECYLIIIGSHGVLWEEINEYIKKLKSYKNIILIKYMTNPFSILKCCDLFVLSSEYEALGLVLLEASILNIPCFSTDIPGPRGFMKQYGGTLVENSEEGIIEGFKLFEKGKIPVVKFDVEKYNENVKKTYYNLFK